MSAEKPTLDDHLRWICKTSIDDGKSHIKAMMADRGKRYTDDQIREALESAQAYEIHTGHRKSLLVSIRSALKHITMTNPPAKVVTKAEFAVILAESVTPKLKPDPAWDNARLYYRAVKTTGRQFIVSQICLGWELHNKKQALGFVGSGRRPESGHVSTLGQKTWEQWVQDELGPDFQRRTADRLIQTFLGFCEKCPKKLRVTFETGGRRSLITTLSKPPSTLSAKDRQTIETAIVKCSDGETQRSLMEELNLVKKHVSLTGGDTSGSKKDKLSDAELMGQLAFKFFQPIAEDLHRMRTNPDREAFLHTIPIVSSEDGEISLTTLEADLEASLHDVRAAKKARMKPTTGKVIS